MLSIQQSIQQACQQLQPYVESPAIDARVLLAHVLKQTTAYLYAYSEVLLTPSQTALYQDLITKRASGMPVAYLTGVKEFWSMPFTVTQDTLIPRPETELLVELTLTLLKDQVQANILELGTGCGAIAIALAKERPDWQITAVDKSAAALAVAQRNAHLSPQNAVKFLLSDWFTHCPQTPFHAIISNPPYVAENDPHLQQGDVRFEPIQALAAGEQGLKDLAFLIEQSCHYLLPGGQLLLEHGFDQKAAIASILYKFGYSDVECWTDWQGKDRISRGVWANP